MLYETPVTHPCRFEPPFRIAQGAALVLIAVLAILAVRNSGRWRRSGPGDFSYHPACRNSVAPAL